MNVEQLLTKPFSHLNSLSDEQRLEAENVIRSALSRRCVSNRASSASQRPPGALDTVVLQSDLLRGIMHGHTSKFENALNIKVLVDNLPSWALSTLGITSGTTLFLTILELAKTLMLGCQVEIDRYHATVLYIIFKHFGNFTSTDEQVVYQQVTAHFSLTEHQMYNHSLEDFTNAIDTLEQLKILKVRDGKVCLIEEIRVSEK